MATPIRNLQNLIRYISDELDDIPFNMIDGVYCPDTKRAVEIFQEKHGLEVNGKTNFETWEKLVEANKLKDLKNAPHKKISPINCADLDIIDGTHNDSVYILQVMLQRICEHYSNINAVPVSGTFTPDHSDTVKKIQKICGIPQTGYVDNITWNNIADIYETVNCIRKIDIANY